MPPTPEDQLGPGGGCTSQDIELMDIAAVCAFFGGSRPLNPATIYRVVAEGRYPQPIKVGKNSNRWLRSECVATLATLIAAPRSPRAYRGPPKKRHLGKEAP
jgi:predicted DNA-binding transcriptional regulator AlpA